MSNPFSKIVEEAKGSGLKWPLMGLGVVLLFNLFFVDGFFALEIRDGRLYGTLIDILNQGSKVMLLALGMTLVIATGGVDLSVGSLMAISGAIAAVMVTQTGVPIGGVFLVAVMVTFVLGCLNGGLVAVAGIQPIVATLIFMVAGRGIAMLVTDGEIVTFEHAGFAQLGNGSWLGLPVTLFVVAGVFCIAVWVTRRTAVGLFIEAVGDNETASRFSGVPNRLIKVLVYGSSGLFAGLAGLIAASNIKAADSSRVGEMMELDAIFAVVVGGTALTGGRYSLFGSIIGALLIQTLTTTMYSLNVPPSIAPVPKAIVIVLVCLLQSESFRKQMSGIFGRKASA
ncbi:ABC transporter permease [Verrucomicrobia bacterium]|nr:ABC transporter permease [Verrucomicrobiota bacterium]